LGLCYTRFRYFDPERARWISPDPLGLAGGTNAFAFNGSPTTTTDPLGLCARDASKRPSDYKISSIADDPRLHALWEDALRDTAASARGNAYTRYLARLENGAPSSGEELSAAFGSANKSFLSVAREAGYDIAEVHHWNYSKADYPDQVFDPRNLFPVDSRGLHTIIHQDTTSDPGDPWGGPVSPNSELPMDSSYYPLANR
jgi:filamentous hemagglutinin